MIDPVGGEPRELDQGRQIRFAITPTGVRVAYAIVGRGPALIVPAAWIGHLEIARPPAPRDSSRSAKTSAVMYWPRRWTARCGTLACQEPGPLH
jgi:hypothetical protein